VSRGLTLRAVAAGFPRHLSPAVLLVATPVAIAARCVQFGFVWRDLAWAVGIVAAQPFSEWLIHVHVLHVRPRGPVTRFLDAAAGRSHRWHHENPRDLDHLFIDGRVVVATVLVESVLWLTVVPLDPRLGTVIATSLTMTLMYEWVHYLIHSDYAPRRALYRGLWRAHRLHHFRNENYWYGVTGHLGDRVLRTYPEKDDVPLSPTARTLADLVA
jgi:hypothetical protein